MKRFLKILGVLFLIIPLFSQKYDSVTFPEFEEIAIKTLADNGIDYMSIYFMTESSLMLVPQYTEYITRKMGYITTEDFKKEGGIINIYSTFVELSWDPKLSDNQKFIGMCAVVGIVANITSNTSWTSSKLYFQDMNDNVEYWITTKACRISSKIKNIKKCGDYILTNLHEVK